LPDALLFQRGDRFAGGNPTRSAGLREYSGPSESGSLPAGAMSAKRYGRCLCGAATCQYEGDESWRAHCHCESCRRNTSSPFTTWFGVPKSARQGHGRGTRRAAGRPGGAANTSAPRRPQREVRPSARSIIKRNRRSSVRLIVITVISRHPQRRSQKGRLCHLNR